MEVFKLLITFIVGTEHLAYCETYPVVYNWVNTHRVLKEAENMATTK